MTPYPAKVEQSMRRFYQSLSEKERRRYAAIEVLKLERGGKAYISRLLPCDDEAITLGMAELADDEALTMKRIRRPGGGRKSCLETMVGLDEAFQKVLRERTAGSPEDERVKWTNLTRKEIAQGLKAAGFPVSVTVVDQLLRKHNYRRRKAQKRRATGEHPQRNEQFENIERLHQEYRESGNPVLSMDTKKRTNRVAVSSGPTANPRDCGSI
ncbi:MAG: hypothetical protein AAFY11_06855 [Cyanobacteria bacterium J06641_5]